MIKCGNCGVVSNAKVKETRGYRRHLCTKCKLEHKDREVICSTSDCRNGINWLQAYAKIKNFTSANETYKCMFCFQNEKEKDQKKTSEPNESIPTITGQISSQKHEEEKESN